MGVPGAKVLLDKLFREKCVCAVLTSVWDCQEHSQKDVCATQNKLSPRLLLFVILALLAKTANVLGLFFDVVVVVFGFFGCFFFCQNWQIDGRFIFTKCIFCERQF